MIPTFRVQSQTTLPLNLHDGTQLDRNCAILRDKEY